MSNHIQAFKAPRNAEGIDRFFKTVPLEQWSLWSFGHEHPQKLFTVLKARYLENIKHIQELGNADVARHAKGLATEAKRHRASEWKQILENQQVQQRMAKHDQARALTMTEELIARCLTTLSMKPLYKYAKIVEAVLKNLHNKDVKKMKEDVFCKIVIDIIILPFMSGECDLLGNSTPSNGSKARRGRGRVPDLSLRLNNSSLGESKVCYGILIQGLEMFFFSLDLSYFQLYRLTLLDTVRLPASTTDLITLLPCFQALARLEALIHSLVLSIRSSSSSNNTANPQDGSDEFTLTSFPSPRM